MLVLAFLIGCKAEAQFLRPADVNALPSKAADHRIAYGTDPLQFGDLRLPASPGPHATAIIIHGGCWVSRFADLHNMSALADALRDAGIATWNVEYRRIDNPGGGWPGTFADIARATDHLWELAAKYNLDLGRVVVMGHSAGGHLALWTASRARLPATSPLFRTNPLPVVGVVSLGGPGDLNAFAEIDERVCGDAVITKLIGGLPEEVPQRYQQASPIRLLPLGVPQILITGAHDLVVPKELGDAYSQAARTSGDEVHHIIVDHAAHHEYGAPTAVTWPVIRRSVFSLLGLR